LLTQDALDELLEGAETGTTDDDISYPDDLLDPEVEELESDSANELMETQDGERILNEVEAIISDAREKIQNNDIALDEAE